MNENDVVKIMIEFIEDKERQLQAEKFSSDSQAKNDVVKSILDKLDKEIKNEDK